MKQTGSWSRDAAVRARQPEAPVVAFVDEALFRKRGSKRAAEAVTEIERNAAGRSVVIDATCSLFSRFSGTGTLTVLHGKGGSILFIQSAGY